MIKETFGMKNGMKVMAHLAVKISLNWLLK